MKVYFFSCHAQIIALWIFHIIVAVLTFYRVHMSLQCTLTHFCSNFMRFHVYKRIFFINFFLLWSKKMVQKVILSISNLILLKIIITTVNVFSF